MQLLNPSAEREMLGYNAIVDKGRRQAPQARVRHEEKVLPDSKRNKLQGTTQEQVRNLSLPAWMVRKHLDYVSKFHFSFRTGKKELDDLVNMIMRWHGSPLNLDIARRFGRDEMFRLFEVEKVMGGDAGLLKLPNIKLQAIESDLIRRADYSGNETVTKSGLVVSAQGAIEKFAIATRGTNGSGYKFNSLQPWQAVIFDAYYSRFGSQFRGVSPLSTAINMIQDIHEGFEYNLIKSKMQALFGIAIQRSPDESGEMGGAGGATSETQDADSTDSGTELDLNPRAVNILDLDAGEKVDTIESKTPSTEFVNGSYLFIQIAMLALDIPISCFDSRKSSFSARIADLNEYEVSCDSKRTKNRYVRKQYSDWLLEEIWNSTSDDFPLQQIATAAGFSLRQVQETLQWIPAGAPWLDKFKQIQGDQLAIEICLDNTIDACRRRGVDFFHNVDMQKIAIEYADENGVPMFTGTQRQQTIEEAIARTVNDAMEPQNDED